MKRGSLPGWWPVAVAAGVQWLPFATAPFLPFVDLPQHVAQAQLLLHRADPAVAALYEVQLLPQVNVLALAVLAPALAVLPESAAVRALLALFIGGLGWGAYRLTRALGTPAWAAAAAMLFAVQFNLWYGFLSFCLGLPLWLVLLARQARALDAADAGTGSWPARPPFRALAADALLWWLLALAHVLLFAFAVAAFVLWIACARDRLAAVRARAVAILPATVWLAAWAVHARRAIATHFGVSSGGFEALWEGPGTKLAELGRALGVATRPGAVEWTVLAIAVAVAAACLWWERRSTRRGRAIAWARLVAVAALAAYACLPYSIYDRDRVTYGLFILYPRFAVLAPLVFAATLAAPASRRARSVIATVIAMALVVTSVHWTMVLQRVGREARGLDAALDTLVPGRILKSLIYTPYPAGLRYEGFLHVASYYQARKLGETDQSFAALVPSPVHYRDPAHRPYLSLHDEHLRPDRFDPAQAELYDYILSYDRASALDPSTARNPWSIVAVDRRR